jgi:HK97 family phage major capsid protein
MKRIEDVRKLPILFRSMTADVLVKRDASDAAKPALYSMSVSSEAEVTRWFGIEVLDHSPNAIDMSRMNNGAAVLVDHYSDQVGVVESATLDTQARKLRADVRFSKSSRGQEVEQDVADNIRRNTSLGYRVISMKQVENRVTPDGNIPVYRVTRWMPYEISIVGVPADASVGVNRAEGDGDQFPVELEEEKMLHRSGLKLDGGAAGGGGGGAAADPAAAAAPAAATRTIETRDNRADFVEIMEMCEANGLSNRATEWIKAGHSPDKVARLILSERQSRGDKTLQPGAESVEAMGASKKDIKRYSFARAILVAAGEEKGGFEAEVNTELERHVPTGVKRHGGFLLPNRLSLVDPARREREMNGPMLNRALDSKTFGKGVELVPDIQGDLIELLRNRAYVIQLGARVLTGLSQPVSFPRQTGTVTTFWVPENPGTNVTASDPALGLATLIPKTIQATTAYSRQFLLTATIDAESWIRDEFGITHGLAFDRAAIHGLGANGEPVGIYKQTGTRTVSVGGAVTYGKLVDMQTQVANLNALDGTLGYLVSPTSAGFMKQTTDFAGSAPGRPIWDGPFQGGTIAGYKAFATNQVSITMSTNEATGGAERGGIFGNWNDLIIGLFAAMEIIVDPYALKKQGVIELTSFQMCDILIRHPESFCKTNGMTS